MECFLEPEDEGLSLTGDSKMSFPFDLPDISTPFSNNTGQKT